MTNLVLITKENLHITGINTYESGDWRFSDHKRKELIGNRVSLHTSRTEPSFVQGVITGFKQVGDKWRVCFNSDNLVFDASDLKLSTFQGRNYIID